MNDNKRFWFFGSKLNTALLLVLIILMIIAIRIMLHNQALYFPEFKQTQTEQPVQPTTTFGMLGNTSDLVSFSIVPGANVHGILSYRGVLKDGYFYEGNVIINILDVNKKTLKTSNAVAKSDWMTVGPVNFEGNIDFSGLAKGPAYFEIHNDNASGVAKNDKSILIPIVIQ